MDFITLATSVKADTSLPFTATVIIAGLGIVLCTLAILVLVFKGFGAVISKTQNKSKKSKNDTNKAQPAPAVAKKTAPTATAANSGVSEEIVAAISAAVYAMEGSGAVVTSVTPVAYCAFCYRRVRRRAEQIAKCPRRLANRGLGSNSKRNKITEYYFCIRCDMRRMLFVENLLIYCHTIIYLHMICIKCLAKN